MGHPARKLGPLDFLVPVEILVPADVEDDFVLNAFTGSLLEIGAARNNNVQLTLETKANKKGFYDELRKALPSQIAERVEWKANDCGVVKVRDLVALSWIPLSVVDLPDGVNVPASILVLFPHLLPQWWVESVGRVRAK
jgi:hypothetical protein